MLLLTGCKTQDREMDRAISFRQKLLASEGCSFATEIYADYGLQLHRFSLSNIADPQGNISFSVTYPESIEGIQGSLAAEGGSLTFDDKVLAFPLLAEGSLSPVSAPWLMLKSLRSGYIVSVGLEDTFLRLTVDDGYEDNAVTLDIWLDGADCPVRADIMFNGSKIVSMNVKEFRML